MKRLEMEDSNQDLMVAEPPSGASPGHILITGGAGFIGSHTVLRLLENGYAVTVVDNLDNSSEEALVRVKSLVGPEAAHNLAFHEIDLREADKLEAIFSETRFDAVIHFAGLKAVGESVAHPLRYYDNNLIGTLRLLEAMAKYDVKQLVFSSSATVYGATGVVPCTEELPLSVTNPYGRTKLMIEDILRDVSHADSSWRIALLRYFNPVGAHPSGMIGEDPVGIPNNLMPIVQRVALGRMEKLQVYGDDYPTKDGTGVRDYIHVMDLADGHIAALHKIASTPDIRCEAFNLGTGKGTSVIEIVTSFERASGVTVPRVFAPRRPGDIAEMYASTAKAKTELGWVAKLDIEEMCRDQWNWAKNNPMGYATPSPPNAASKGVTPAAVANFKDSAPPVRKEMVAVVTAGGV